MIREYVYIVWCEFYQEASIEKIFKSEDSAKAYVDENNKKWNSKNAWYYFEEEVYK